MKQFNYHRPEGVKPTARPRSKVPRTALGRKLNNMPVVKRFTRLSRKKKVLVIAILGILSLFIIGVITTVIFASSLGSKETIMNRNKTGVTLLDRNGQSFYEFYNARSDTYVTLDKISEPVKVALISSEDKDFYKHHGFSPLGIINAVWQNIKPGGLDSGGSTITQQLVASALLNKQRSYLRKYQELVLSIEIERRYSKDQILEMYLNSVYFGEGAFGIEDAAKAYFGVSANDLNTAQATMLIGLLPAPAAYSPISGKVEWAEERQDYVLGRMKEDGKISETDAKAADDLPLSYQPASENNNSKAPHFALMVRDELIKRFGEETITRSGYRVKTSLDLNMQNIAEKAVVDQVNALAGSNVSNGGAVVIDPRYGEVRALVGSKGWSDPVSGKLNIATANRQPGSSFKPIVYGTGIENRKFTAASLWNDRMHDFGGGYIPYNYDRRFRGNVTTRRALANSLNVPAVEALEKAGIGPTLETARNLGLTTLKNESDYGLSLSLGAAETKLTEMTNAYATFANAGKKNDLTTILSITDKSDKELFKYTPKNQQAISAQTSYILTSMLSDNAARAEMFGGSLTLNGGRKAAVKTGTTENYRDALAIGYTPSLVTGVWIGNNDGALMSSIAGSSGAAPIWRNIMNQSLAGTPNEEFAIPSDISSSVICRANGALAVNKDGEATLTEYFRPGTLPTAKCNEKPKEEDKPVEEKPKEEEPEDKAATPAEPSFAAVCGPKNDTWEAAETTGVKYEDKWTGDDLTITATAEDGYTVSGTTSWTHTDANEPCTPPPTPGTPPITP